MMRTVSRRWIALLAALAAVAFVGAGYHDPGALDALGELEHQGESCPACALAGTPVLVSEADFTVSPGDRWRCIDVVANLPVGRDALAVHAARAPPSCV